MPLNQCISSILKTEGRRSGSSSSRDKMTWMAIFTMSNSVTVNDMPHTGFASLPSERLKLEVIPDTSHFRFKGLYSGKPRKDDSEPWNHRIDTAPIYYKRYTQGPSSPLQGHTLHAHFPPLVPCSVGCLQWSRAVTVNRNSIAGWRDSYHHV